MANQEFRVQYVGNNGEIREADLVYENGIPYLAYGIKHNKEVWIKLDPVKLQKTGGKFADFFYQDPIILPPIN